MKFLFFSFSAFLSNTIFSYTKRQNVKLLFFYLKYVFPFIRLTHFPTMSFLHNKKVKTLRIHFSAFFSLSDFRLSCLPQLHLIKIAMIYFTRCAICEVFAKRQKKRETPFSASLLDTLMLVPFVKINNVVFLHYNSQF